MGDDVGLPVPPPVAVELPAKLTVLLVLDAGAKAIEKQSFREALPKIQQALAKARGSSVQVIYTFTRSTGAEVANGIEPQEEDVVIETYGADKFYNTRLEDMLFFARARYVVLVGTATNGAVLYTAFEAIMRGYMPVVIRDCTSADNDSIQQFALWQILNSPGRKNPRNEPLAPLAATITSENLLKFR